MSGNRVSWRSGSFFVRRKALVQVWQAHLRAGRKRYLALVHGVPGWETEQVDAPLRYVKRLGRPAVVEEVLCGAVVVPEPTGCETPICPSTALFHPCAVARM